MAFDLKQSTNRQHELLYELIKEIRCYRRAWFKEKGFPDVADLYNPSSIEDMMFDPVHQDMQVFRSLKQDICSLLIEVMDHEDKEKFKII